jgi:hypothetical protein
MNLQKQNQRIGHLLLELNHDLEVRENPEVQVGLLEMIGYVVVGLVSFILISGILRALFWRLP